MRDSDGTVGSGTREEATSKDIVLVAINWSRLRSALAGLPDFCDGAVLNINLVARSRWFPISRFSSDQCGFSYRVLGRWFLH